MQGHKFVVGTSSKCMYMVYSDPNIKEVDWNSSVLRSKFKSSIVSCGFGPSGRVIAAVSFDGTCKILSAFHKSIDTEPGTGPFAEVDDFGAVLAEFKCPFWLNHVSWDPSGNGICYCSHDGTLNFCDLSKGKKGGVAKYTHRGLPFTRGAFIDSDTFIAAGYDKCPFLFKRTSESWKLEKCLDEGFTKMKDFSVTEGETDSKRFFKNKET